jgi:prepilin peptidase CpaA
VRTRRIPNPLTFCLVAFGICASGISGGWAGALESSGLVAATILVGSVIYARRWLAGGDIKLIAAGVAVFGYQSSLEFLCFTALCGGVLATVVALRQRRLIRLVEQISYGFMLSGTSMQASKQYGSVPYGLAIAAGAAVVMLSQYFTGLRLPL